MLMPLLNEDHWSGRSSRRRGSFIQQILIQYLVNADTILGRLRDILGEDQVNKIDKDPCPDGA